VLELREPMPKSGVLQSGIGESTEGDCVAAQINDTLQIQNTRLKVLFAFIDPTPQRFAHPPLEWRDPSANACAPIEVGQSISGVWSFGHSKGKILAAWSGVSSTPAS
jgi:hypothetical protein